MKFRFFSIFALSGFLLSSCAVDELPAEGGSIIAEMETDQTRTAVTDEGTFTWSSGDKVWLHTTSGSVVGTLSSGAGSSSATFSYGGFVGEMTGKAVCPYNDGHSVSGEVLNFVLPASYDLGTSLTNTNAAMYGVNVGGTFKFNHLAGVMRFKFKDVPAGVNKFTITLDQKINGTFTTDLTADYPIIKTTTTSTVSEKITTLNFNALTEKSDIILYVPLPVGTYNSLEIGLYDNEQSVWTYSNTVTNTVNRKSLKLMPVVTLGGSIGGEIEGNDPSEVHYIDEYGINHGEGVEINGVIWAPVNCGYHATDYKYGKLYQWGRKYGQGYGGDIVNLEGEVIGTYYDSDLPDVKSGPISVLEANDQANSNVFYYGLHPFYDWLDQKDDTLWNAGTESDPIKTEYDPCPDGWRVPTYQELEALTLNNSSWTTNDAGQVGFWFSGNVSYTENASQLFLSAAGGIRYHDGFACARGNYGYYWSSTCGGNYAYELLIHNNDDEEVWLGTVTRSYAFPVRCVQITD